jgi:negative regulator of replication initiation
LTFRIHFAAKTKTLLQEAAATRPTNQPSPARPEG